MRFNNRSITANLLYPVIFLYQTVSLLKASLYHLDLLKPKRVSKPVISVGNITMGGSGKTPFVIWLCTKLIEKGFKPAVLTRGYGRRDENKMLIIEPGAGGKYNPAETGDEPLVIHRRLPQVPVICNADRIASAREAIKRFDPDILVLDDGFQHMRLARDADIVMVPSKMGLLKREFNHALMRADIIIDTGKWRRRRIYAAGTVYSAQKKIAAVAKLKSGKEFNLNRLKGKRVILVSGIAGHKRFYDMVKETGAEITDHLKYKDHYNYTPEDIRAIEKSSESEDASFIITTEKDAVKISQHKFAPERWFAVKLDMEVEGSDQFMEEILQRTSKVIKVNR